MWRLGGVSVLDISTRARRAVARANDEVLAVTRPPGETVSQSTQEICNRSTCCSDPPHRRLAIPDPGAQTDAWITRGSWAMERQNEFAHAEVAASRSGPAG